MDTVISIVTGTLNRLEFLQSLIKNTVDADPRLELVLVDGGSTDGSLAYLEGLQHPQINVIKLGKKSHYGHFMNKGVEAAKGYWICQWNDDVQLMNSWDEVFSTIESHKDLYIFSKKYMAKIDMDNKNFTEGGWVININKQYPKSIAGICLNFGLYKKRVIKDLGMYDERFSFYHADLDLTARAVIKDHSYELCDNIKVAEAQEAVGQNPFQQDIPFWKDWGLYLKNLIDYSGGRRIDAQCPSCHTFITIGEPIDAQ